MTSPSFAPANSLGNFLPENIVIPTDQDQYKYFLKKTFEEHARFINRKDTGSYDQIEQVINQQYYGATPQVKSEVYRKVFPFAPGGVNPYAFNHNITQITTFTRIYGTCIINANDFRCIPFVSVAALNQGIQIDVTSTQIVITNGVGNPAIQSGIVVLEYLKQ
jgi:hypothetical protein